MAATAEVAGTAEATGGAGHARTAEASGPSGTSEPSGPSDWEVEWLGLVPYAEALEIQQSAVDARRAGSASDRLLLLEHPPVITLGRSAAPENVLATPEALAARGIETFEVRRGGDVTYHAPGQLVGYLVCDLAAASVRDGRPPDVHRFLRTIESALIEAMAELGVPGERRDGMTGVFAAHGGSPPAIPRKIASIGVGLRGWVSYHGFALNVTTDLSGFDAIVPCGLQGVEMTSILRELGASAPDPLRLGSRARDAVSAAFSRHFAPSGGEREAEREAGDVLPDSDRGSSPASMGEPPTAPAARPAET